MRKNQDIQILRGIAVTLVFFEHISGKIPTPAAFGFLREHVIFWIGVELFLAISGYVMTTSIIRSLASSNNRRMTGPDFQLFWRRRLLRLMPASLVWIVIAILAAPLFSLPPTEQSSSLLASVFAISGTYNFYFPYCQTHGLVGTLCPSYTATHIYWSLSLEEQFYLFLSLLLLFVPMRLLLPVCATIAVGFFLFFWDNTNLYGNWHIAYAGLHRGYGLLFGVMLACWASKGGNKAVILQAAPALRLALIIGLITSLALLPKYMPTPIPLWVMAPLLGLISTGVVLLSLADGAMGRTLVGRGIYWIGERSYSFYLSHIIAIYAVGVACRKLAVPSTDSAAYIAVLCAFGLGLVFAHFSYVLVECRFQEKSLTKSVDTRILAS